MYQIFKCNITEVKNTNTEVREFKIMAFCNTVSKYDRKKVILETELYIL